MKAQDWRRPLPGLIAWVAIGSVAAEKSFGQGDEMREHARLVRIESIADGQNRATEMLPDSLLNFNDPVGTTLSGSLWAWGGTGRPLAILELSKLTAGTNSVRWVSGVTSFSPGSIVATWDDGQRWQSSAPGLTMNPVPDAPAPADSEAERLRQMKAISRKFALREDAGRVKGKLELRLLPSPIHRYSDAGSGLRDGAIFAFAYGTNPEAFLVVESRSTGGAAPAWHYGLARVTGGALAGELDGREVWSVAEANPPHSGPAYMNRHHSAVRSK